MDYVTRAICAYTYGMDTGNWEHAVSRVAEEVDVDYTAVGMLKGRLKRSELREFLESLLKKPNLAVHTTISQVFPDPKASGEILAYYSVRHYKGVPGNAVKFAVHGWYAFRFDAELLSSITIRVSAIEGDSTALA